MLHETLATVVALILMAAYAPQSIEVIDADTLRIDGVRSRILNLDAPETGGRAECDAERMLAEIANERAEQLIKEDDFLVWPSGEIDYFRRPLIRVTVNSRHWADILIQENLAVKWAGKRHDWCKPL